MNKKPLNSGKPWTPSDVKLLKEDIRHHTPTRKIATHLKRTVDAIYDKCSELHLSLRYTPRMAVASRMKW